MAVTAAIVFTQGSNFAAAGVALIGVAGTALVVSNGSDANVVEWKFEIVDVSSLSSLTIGVKQDGVLPSYTFTPDANGGYLLHLTVFDTFGNFSEDFRVFQVPETSGRIIPPFKATDKSLNFVIGGVPNLRGWAPFMEAYLRLVDTLAGQTVAVVKWQTALNLDLTVQANTNFFTDGVHSFAGMTWQKIKSAADGTTANVNGTGLVFHPVSSLPNGLNTGAPLQNPQLWLPFSQIPGLVGLAADWPLRFSVRVLGTGTSVTGAGAGNMISGGPAGTDSQYFASYKAPTNTFGVSASSASSGAGVNYANATEYTNSDVVVVEFPTGLQALTPSGLVGAYSAGWPANSSLLHIGQESIFASSSFASGGRIGAWGVSLLAFWVAGSPTVTFTNFRVEYLPR